MRASMLATPSITDDRQLKFRTYPYCTDKANREQRGSFTVRIHLTPNHCSRTLQSYACFSFRLLQPLLYTVI